jgi:hypothetical protein
VRVVEVVGKTSAVIEVETKAGKQAVVRVFLRNGRYYFAPCSDHPSNTASCSEPISLSEFLQALATAMAKVGE